MAHVKKSRPAYGHGFQEIALIFQFVHFSLESGISAVFYWQQEILCGLGENLVEIKICGLGGTVWKICRNRVVKVEGPCLA